MLCGTKYDISRDIDYSIITELVRRYNIKYYEISSKTDYNMEKPFIEILRNLENKIDSSESQDFIFLTKKIII